MTTLLAAVTVPERSAIADRDTWDLSKMYASQADWDRHYAALDGMVSEWARLKGTVGGSAAALHSALTQRDRINIELEKLYAYAAMRRDEDMRRPESQALFQRAQSLAVKYDEAASWFQPEILQIPEPRLREWLKEETLKVYGHYLDDLMRTKAHILSPREEELLAMAGKALEASGDAFGLLSNTELRWRSVKDSAGRDVEITSATFYQAMASKDRRYRLDAFAALHESHVDVRNTLAATLAGALQRDWYYAKARGYPTSLHRALDAENLPLGVYHNLIQTVNDHRQLLHRYVGLKKKVLGLDAVHFYDLYVNLVDVPERSYTFDEAREMVLDGIQAFGPEYAAVMKRAFESR